jgi:alkaline phosphatase D
VKLLAPTVGPIVGYTTPDATRIWLRGELHRTADGYRRAFGVARIRAVGSRAWGPPVFTKLQPHFDMTGICVLGGLATGSAHEYQAGWFFSDKELTDCGPTMPLDWSAAGTGAVTTAAPPGATPRRYAVGSCRYLMRLFGGALFDERGDKTFRTILEQHETPEGRLDALVMLGDQIYADDLGPVGADRSIDDYLSRYRMVFGQPHLRKLMSRLPNYMILDDHEIENDWPKHATSRDRQTTYPAAIHAYQVYQASHSPLFALSPERRVDGVPDRLWYSFRDGCCDWFVMDTRTERRYHGGPDKDRMLNDVQMNALLAWLADGSGQVKVIASAIPLFPDVVGEADDKWAGFRAQRAAILGHIFAKKVPKVVVLSGDLHCSFVAELTSAKQKGQKLVQVVSSSFFWPYPHMRRRELRMDAKLVVPKGGAGYRAKVIGEVIKKDNFARVEVEPSRVRVNFVGRKGEALGSVSLML